MEVATSHPNGELVRGERPRRTVSVENPSARVWQQGPQPPRDATVAAPVPRHAVLKTSLE